MPEEDAEAAWADDADVEEAEERQEARIVMCALFGASRVC